MGATHFEIILFFVPLFPSHDRLEYLASKEKKQATFSAADMTARQLMWALQQKDDCPSSVRALILDIFEVK